MKNPNLSPTTLGRRATWMACMATSLVSLTHAQVQPELPPELPPADWEAIEQEHVRHRYGAVKQAGGFEAANPTQQWLAEFDGDGMSIRPQGALWSWGLELRRFGFDGCSHDAVRATTHVDGNRVAYQWDANIEEWYVNDRRGLEHGFTVLERPGDAGDCAQALIFELDVDGDLTGVESADRRGVRFVDSDGAVILSYTGLIVLDANGVELPAELRCEAGTLRFEIDESGAAYPLLVDPIVQQAYLKASNTDAGDSFGSSIAAYGDRVVVGAPLERSLANTVNGNEADNMGSLVGAAYVFERTAGAWSQVAYLKASNSENDDRFGTSVAIFDDRVVVGAPGESSASTGVNGSQANAPLGFQSGAAYLFNGSSGTWVQEAYIKASNPGIFHSFGTSVGITLDRIIVGAPNESSGSTGVNGSGANSDAFMQSGAAYVFVLSGGLWAQEAYLKASNTDAADLFGSSVAIFTSLIAVGAPDEDSAATGINGSGTSNAAANAGAAYVFEFAAGGWAQTAYVKASNTDAGDGFGGAVAVDGGILVVGAIGEDGAATGVNGVESDNSLDRAGAAYVFLLGDSMWSQVAYLKASNTESVDFFGAAVDIAGQKIIVGAPNEDSSSVGLYSDEADNTASASGAAYLFDYLTTNWEQVAYMKASNTDAGDLFGASVAIDGDLVAIGALVESSGAMGVNGDQTSNTASGSGAAYAFDTDVDVTPYCVSFPNIIGQIGQITWSGSSQAVNNNFTLTTSSLPPNEFGIFLASMTQANIPFAGGTSNGVLCLGGSIARFNRAGEILSTGSNGTFSLMLDLTDFPIGGGSVAVMSGESWNFQAWHREQTGNGANLTNAIQVTFL